MDDALQIRGIEYLNVETCLLLAPPFQISGDAPGYGYLTSNQNVFICTTHIKKVIAKLYFFILRSKAADKQ